jgi:hypothetical protein
MVELLTDLSIGCSNDYFFCEGSFMKLVSSYSPNHCRSFDIDLSNKLSLKLPCSLWVILERPTLVLDLIFILFKMSTSPGSQPKPPFHFKALIKRAHYSFSKMITYLDEILWTCRIAKNPKSRSWPSSGFCCFTFVSCL